MLTARGWWLLMTVLALLVLSLGTGSTSLILVCFTLLAWMLGIWFTFAVKMRLLEANARVERELRDERGSKVRTLWSGQKVHVTVALHCDSGVSLPYVRIVDRVPILVQFIDGDQRGSGPLGRDVPIEAAYRVECIAAGTVRFEGLQVQVADLQGLFQRGFFVRSVTRFAVYPALAEGRGKLAAVKRQNALPLLGTHRHRRPGSGSELLDLRDYLPGDPPKMIAWKASARRDRLMTKEFESEVPVRCTLFVDVSASVRVGRLGRNALARLIDIAAGVVQVSTAAKDLTGICLIEETGVRKLIRPGRGPRHRLRLMAALSDAADLPLESEHVSLDRVLPLAYGLAQDVYPDLLDDEVNAFPFWLPYWAPQPGYTQRLPLLTTQQRLLKPWFWLRNRVRRLRHRMWQSIVGRMSGRRRRLYRWRKKLAALLAVRHNLGPGGLALLLEDDALCRRHIQRFLAEHQVTFPVPLYDAQGRYLFAAPGKVDVLSQALLHSVVRGRDNELFVLLVDVLEVGSHLDRLLHAVRVARARHHRVLAVCPWPTEVPLPERDQEDSPAPTPATNMQELFFQASTLRLQQAGRELQRTFARLGVPILFSPQEQAVPLILHQMQQLRLQQRGGV